MINLKLMELLAKCDGKNATCKDCDYREHPACREAMAREAAAEMYREHTRLKIAKEMLGKVTVVRDEAMETVRGLMQACEARDTLIKRIFRDLDERRDCPTCRYHGCKDEEGVERCRGCMTCRSAWMPKDKYCRVEPVEAPQEDAPDPELVENIQKGSKVKIQIGK